MDVDRSGLGGDAGSERARALDAYWRSRDAVRARARSRDRARDAVSLLAARGISGGRLLDAGCGPGWALEVFARAGFDVAGFDASPFAVEAARAAGFDARTLDIEAADPERALRELGEFRAVTALEVLEHLRDPLRALEFLGRLVEAPGGALVISLPNEIHLAARLRALVGRPPFGGHDDPHLRHFDLRGARRLIRASGFRERGVRWQSVVPPRAGLLRRILSPLVKVSPGLFAISAVYLLEVPPHGTR